MPLNRPLLSRRGFCLGAVCAGLASGSVRAQGEGIFLATYIIPPGSPLRLDAPASAAVCSL